MRTMKVITVRKLLFAIVLSTFASNMACGDSPAVRNCTWCHGISGEGIYPAPALAGQRSQYIQVQLSKFASHERDNPFSRQYMWPATEALSAQSALALSIYFSELSPRVANDGVSELADFGKRIYENGEPEANIVACIACHGPNAVGVREIPRLAGLSNLYLKRKLEEWGEGFHTSSLPMSRIASKLPAEEIDALASYLSFVK